MDELPRVAGLLEWPMIIGPTSLGESRWPEVLRDAPPNWTQQPFPQKIKMSPKKGPFQRFNHHVFFSWYVSLMGSNFSSIGYAISGASVTHPYNIPFTCDWLIGALFELSAPWSFWCLFKKTLRLKFAARAKHIRCTVVRNEARDVCSNHPPLHAARWLRLRPSAAPWKVSWTRRFFRIFRGLMGSDLDIQKWTVNLWMIFDIQINLIIIRYLNICIFHSGKIFQFTKEENMCSNSGIYNSIFMYFLKICYFHIRTFGEISRLPSIFANWLENILYLQNHFWRMVFNSYRW